jgi:hypothetical protein
VRSIDAGFTPRGSATPVANEGELSLARKAIDCAVKTEFAEMH